MGDQPAISYTRKLLRANWHLADNVGSFSPGGREGATMSWVDGNLYVFGGIENGIRTSTLLKFDSITHRWTQYPFDGAAPAPRCQHSAWVIGKKLFIFGGEGKGIASEEQEEEEKHSKIYTVKQSDVFKDTNEQRGIRRICFDDIGCFDTEFETWTEVRSGLSPLPRKGHSSIIVAPGTTFAVLVVFGGAPSGKGRPMNDLHTVEAQSLSAGVAMWSKKKPGGQAPSARLGHAAASTTSNIISSGSMSQSCLHDDIHNAGCMVVFGGTAGTGELFNDVHVYDVETNCWHPLVCQGQIPTPRHGHSAQIIQRSVTRQMGIEEPIFVTYGGVMRDGTDATFSRDLHILHLKNRYWVLVKTAHLFPSPRYGHSLVLVPEMKAWYHGAPLPPKDEGRVEDTRMLAKREAKTAFEAGAEEGLSMGTLFLFGGLNTMYSSGELWTAWLEMRNPGGQFAFTGSMEKAPQLGLAQQMIADLEGVVIKERKARLKADHHVMREREAKMRVEEECAELKQTIRNLKEMMEEKEARFETKLNTMATKYQEEQDRCTKLRTELRESHNLLLLVDLSSNLRLQAWQSKTAPTPPVGVDPAFIANKIQGIREGDASVLNHDAEDDELVSTMSEEDLENTGTMEQESRDSRGFPKWE
jgi:hypothetical protein